MLSVSKRIFAGGWPAAGYEGKTIFVIIKIS